MELAVINRLREACLAANSRRLASPGYAVLESACKQADYVYAVASGIETDKSRLREIIVGVYAIREFDDSDPELATALKDVQFVADRMAKGLKVSIADLKR